MTVRKAIFQDSEVIRYIFPVFNNPISSSPVAQNNWWELLNSISLLLMPLAVVQVYFSDIQERKM